MNQATFFATITDTTPGTVTDLPAPTSDDPASVGLTETPATSGNTVAGFSRLPILRKSRPEPSRHVSGASQRTPSGGTVMVAEAGRPCHFCSTASTAPRLPTPLPP
jgi:hypothetical protein